MLKKILVILGLCLLAGYLIFAIFFFEDKPLEKICNNFEIEINGNTGNHFVDAAALQRFIDSKGLNPYGKQIKNINTYQIQEVLLSNKLIKSAEVFVTSSGGIRAVVNERVPILRIVSPQGEGYYVDQEGKTMPLSSMGTAYLPVASGAISQQLAETDLYKFALFLQNDNFWNAQIEQIVVHSAEDIDLITRVGGQIVKLGSLADYDKKLAKLKTFYDKVLPETGWNRYTQINLKYDKQVVATKR